MGFSSLSAGCRLDLTDIKAVLQFKEIYKDMQKQDTNLPNPHILLQGLSKIPITYLHEENWVFEVDSLEKLSEFTHIMSYSGHLRGFKVIFSVDFNFFDLSSFRSRSVTKVHDVPNPLVSA
jgi:hypothetical protein